MTSTAVAGEALWTQWIRRSTRLDGSAQPMRGVASLGVIDGRAAWGPFHLETVDNENTGVDAGLTRIVEP